MNFLRDDVVAFIDSLSCIWLFVTSWTAAVGFSVLYYFLEFAETHDHRVDGAIQPSHKVTST